MTNINEICYFYIRSVLGYSENHIITPQNFSEMKKKYQLFESQKRDFAMEIGPPQMPLTYTLPDDEKVFRCCFYTIERPFIFGIAINKRTFVFSHRGLQSENCELIDVTHVNIETK